MSFSRTRHQAKPPEIVPYTSHFFRPSTGETWGHGSGAMTVQEDVLTMWDNPTPRFQELRSRGAIINTPMKRERRVIELTPKPAAIASLEHDVGFTRTLECPTPMGWDVPSDVQGVINDCRTLAITQARSRVASPDAMQIVSYLERKETFEMLAKPVGLLVGRTEPLEKLIRRLIGKGARRPQLVSEIANWWLTYRYGIMPLIYDIEGVLKALKAQDRPVRETARAKSTDTTESLVSNTAGPFWWGDVVTDTVATEWDIQSRAGVLYEYESTLQRRLGLTLYDIPTALLESLTLSFTLNWVSNVSEYVASLSADFRSDVRAQWVTTEVKMRREIVRKVTITPNATRSYLMQDVSGAKSLETLELKYRDPATSSDAGVRLRLQMSYPRIADALALVYGRLAGRLKR